MLKEELLKLLGGLPDKSELPFKVDETLFKSTNAEPIQNLKPSEVSKAEPKPAEFSKTEQPVISMNAQDLLRFFETFTQANNNPKTEVKEEENAEIFIY